MQLRVRHIARNVLSNWIGTIANMAVAFFLSPLIVHRLGDIAFGIWVLAVSVVAYMNLLDLGMQSSVLRFVNKGHTQHDHQAASEALSAALWIRLQFAAVILACTVGLAKVFPYFFRIPHDLVRAAQIAVLLIGLKVALNMGVGVFAGVLSALNRYDLRNIVDFVQTAIRAIGVVTVLLTGHGIVAIAVCELAASVVSNILLVIVARHIYPELRVRLGRPRKETLQHIWTYSAYVFMNTVAIRLIYQTDSLVVGKFVSVAAVTYYMIANNLITYTSQVIDGIGGTFVPAASTFEAAGNSSALRSLYKNGTRIILIISQPILITLIIRGSSFIGLWMGARYARESGIILAILATGRILSFANRTAPAIAYGIEKHKTPAKWAIGEGVANLSLSILLVRWYGIYGVALGTLIPSLFVQLVFWPRYVSKLVGVTYLEVVGKLWAPMLLASVPFAAATYAVNVFFPAHSLIVFMLQVIAVLPVFVICLALMYRTYLRRQLLPQLRSLIFSAGTRP